MSGKIRFNGVYQFNFLKMNKKWINKIVASFLVVVGLFSMQVVAMAALPSPIPPDSIIPQINPDLFAKPKLAVVEAVPAETYDSSPDFTFHSTHSGVITYDGDCTSATTDAVGGNNTITLHEMSIGNYTNCRLLVTGSISGKDSDYLNIAPFEVKLSLIIDITAPTLTLVEGVTSPTMETMPSVTFNSDEAGVISYEGACSSSSVAAVDGDNVVIFDALAVGAYANCKIKVADSNGNVSNALQLPTFTIVPPMTLKCEGFTDVLLSDGDCLAIAYMKSIGAMTGNPDGTFDPDGLLQRDQVAKIALEAFGNFNGALNYCGGVDPFPDVVEADWAYQYVCRSKALDVITGYLSGPDAGFFRPSRSVNRVEFLAIILRNLGEAIPVGASYTDVHSTDWYADYAKYSKDNSLFVGTKLYPGNFTSRREVADVLYTLHNLGKI